MRAWQALRHKRYDYDWWGDIRDGKISHSTYFKIFCESEINSHGLNEPISTEIRT